MSTYDLPQEPELMVKSRQAAYCVLRRLDGADDLTVQDMEDLIQTAALAYWKHHQEGRSVPYCFVCARQAAEKYFYRRILGRNPRNPLSLDIPLNRRWRPFGPSPPPRMAVGPRLHRRRHITPGLALRRGPGRCAL